MRGLKFTLDHPKDAVGMLKKHQPQLDEDVALQEVEILRDLTNSKNAKILGAMTQEKMLETQNLMVKYMDLQNPENVSGTYTNEFLS